MEALNDKELIDGWKLLLFDKEKSNGVRSIPIEVFEQFRVSLAVIYPENQEAILFEFNDENNVFYLPEFELEGLFFTKSETLTSTTYNQVFLLGKNNEQDISVFNTICLDLLSYARKNYELSSQCYFNDLKKRLNVWIDFLKNGDCKALSLRGQIGLIGELLALKRLKTLFPNDLAWINSWKGPEKFSKDFVTKDCAIEVKSILSDELNVNISSIEQLDTKGISNLFLSVYRFEEDLNKGKNINHFVDFILSEIICEKAMRLFLSKLEEVGYYLSHQKNYNLHFSRTDTLDYSVSNEFPCLTKCNLPFAITSAKYKLDLTSLSQFKVLLEEKIKG